MAVGLGVTVGDGVGVGVNVGDGVAVGNGVTVAIGAIDVCSACRVACGWAVAVLAAIGESDRSDEGSNPHAAMHMDATKTMMEKVCLDVI